MRKLNFTILLAILTLWSANTLAAEVCNAMAITEKGGYGTGSKPTAAKAKKQAMSSCGLANPKDTCVVISVACQKQDKETDTKQTGKVVDYLDWRDGIAYAKGSNIPFTGKFLTHHDNGQKWDEKNYKAGKAEGIWTRWHGNGQKSHERNYKAGKREGIHTDWNYNGQKVYEGNYKAGKKEGIHTLWFDNGQKWQEVNYKAGKPEGIWIDRHHNGQKSAEKNYKAGKLEGRYTTWRNNGQKQSEGNYKAGKLVGELEYW